MNRIAYISLMSGLPWGGSEAFWNTRAFESLENGHAVFVWFYDWGQDTHPKISDRKQHGQNNTNHMN